MTTLLTYTIEAGIYLLLGHLAYSLFVAEVKQPRFNRLLLWALMAVSLLMPALPEITATIVPATVFNGAINIGNPEILDTENSSSWHSLWQHLSPVYTTGIIISALYLALSMIKIVNIITSNPKTTDGNVTIVWAENKISPFSWMHYIIMNDTGNRDEMEMIEAHEKAHISRLHSVDLAIASVMCVLFWYNPAIWLWRRHLTMSHEYEADADVINHGFDIRSYQTMLIKKAVGTRLQSLANNLNHSKLKKRITMMMRKQNKCAAFLRTMTIVPAIVGAMAVVNIPAVAAVIDTPATSKVETVSEITKNSASTQAQPVQHEQSDASAKPSFPGGDIAMLQYIAQSVRYPEQAKKENLQGTVVVKFKIQTDGTITDVQAIKPVHKLLDDEAIRVIKNMPKWIAGKENGKPVVTTMAIPVSFKTTGNDEKPAKNKEGTEKVLS